MKFFQGYSSLKKHVHVQTQEIPVDCIEFIFKTSSLHVHNYCINYDTYTCMHVHSIYMLISLVAIDNGPCNLWLDSIHKYFILGGDRIQDECDDTCNFMNSTNNNII